MTDLKHFIFSHLFNRYLNMVLESGSIFSWFPVFFLHNLLQWQSINLLLLSLTFITLFIFIPLIPLALYGSLISFLALRIIIYGVDQWKLLFLPKTNLDLLMVLVHKLIFQLIFILNGTIAMLLSSIGSSTPFAKNFQLVLFLLRVPVLFGRIFKNATAKLMGPEFIISITLFLLTLKDLCNGRMLRIGKNMLVVLLSPTSALF
ncbi:uncharacterized protein LOC108452180 [Gossypium arboreum]|uniref:uncharacterized protein LOC108452180 n=1 Tax=Gossypium arboreum TaxID=29729 RepID=UPI0008193567|nr:uncharacterized protein LOC108452180 [Gossypium arboreum]